MVFKQPHTNTKVLGTMIWWQDGFTDTKRVNRNRNWKKNILQNGQNERDKRINNDVQNTTQKTKDRHEPHKETEGELGQLQFIYKSDVDTIVSSAAPQSPPPHMSVMLTQ